MYCTHAKESFVDCWWNTNNHLINGWNWLRWSCDISFAIPLTYIYICLSRIYDQQEVYTLFCRNSPKGMEIAGSTRVSVGFRRYMRSGPKSCRCPSALTSPCLSWSAEFFQSSFCALGWSSHCLPLPSFLAAFAVVGCVVRSSLRACPVMGNPYMSPNILVCVYG